MHGRHGEVAGGKLVGKPVDLATGVAEDNGLRDGHGLIEIGECVKLPLLLLDGDVELLDTLKGELVLLDKNADGVAHELGGDLKNVLGHGGREQNDLGGLRQQLEDVVDLLSETALEEREKDQSLPRIITKKELDSQKASRRPRRGRTSSWPRS